MKNKKLLALFGCTISCCLTTMIVFTMAWFTSRSSIETHEKIGGSVLQNYFHSGVGTADDPFTITTPWHYENFVKLHYAMQGFSEEKYYFEFGANIDDENPSDKLFYATSTSGVVDYENYSTVLDLRGLLLPPLGTEEQPFQGKLNGNNLTVQNFTVAAEGYNDVGIFGYVTCNVYKEDGSPVTGEDIPEGYVKNCYWRDFTIDTTMISPLVHQHEVEASAHTDFSHMGYLAGHIKYAAAFENCYVNDCVIKGGSQAARSIDSYGYFGKVEVDATGGNSGKGNDYSFNLDSDVVYNYLSENYSTISGQPFRSRDTEYNAQDINPDFSVDHTKVTNQLSQAITSNNGEFTLNGDWSETGLIFSGSKHNSPRNYSLSTIGYQPLDPQSISTVYDLYIKEGDQYKPLTTYEGDVIDINTLDYFNDVRTIIENDQKGIWFDDVNNRWSYYDVTSHEDDNAYDFTIKFDFSNCNVAPGHGYNNVTAYISLDNTVMNTTSLASNVSCISNTISLGTSDGKVSGEMTFKVHTQLGIHKMGIVLLLNATEKGWFTSYTVQEAVYGGGLNRNGTTGTMTGANVKFDTDGNAFTLNCTGHEEYNNRPLIGGEIISTLITNDTANFKRFGSLDSASVALTPIYGLKQGTTTGYTFLTTENYSISPETYTYSEKAIEVDPETGEEKEIVVEKTGYKWTAISQSQKRYLMEEDGETPVGPQYISDHFNDYIDPNLSESERKKKEYHHENIDVVGGGVTFERYNNSTPIIGLRTEKSNNYMMKSVESNSKMGAKFYATELCNSCVVMYMKNTANAADNNDDKLGNIEFEYINISIGGSEWITLTRPVFKKGNGEVINIEQLANQSQQHDDGLDLTTVVPCEISELGAKKCCYCALDKDGYICATFNTDGSVKSWNQTKFESQKKALESIATYVICLGADGYGECYITQVQFDYKAATGYGGVFGSVGYRDSPDTLESTILNFYFDNPENNQYYVKVSYAAVEVGSITDHPNIIGVYNIILRSETQLECNFFNYDREHYYLTINGVPYYDINIYTITISASDPATWTT